MRQLEASFEISPLSLRRHPPSQAKGAREASIFEGSDTRSVTEGEKPYVEHMEISPQARNNRKMKFYFRRKIQKTIDNQYKIC